MLFGHPDDPHGNSAEQDHFSQRVFAIGEQFIAGVIIDNRILITVLHGSLVKPNALIYFIAAHPVIIDTNTGHRRGCLDIAIADRNTGGNTGRDAVDIILIGKGGCVVSRQGTDGVGIAVAKILAALDVDGVGADGTDAF